MIEPHVYSFVVSYGDSDAAGVLYYARYLNNSEKARLSWMDALGYDWKNLHFQKNVIFPVREVNIIYKKPFSLGDIVWIHTRLKSLQKYHLHLEQRFLNEKQELCTLCQIKVVCLKDNRLEPINRYFSDKKHEK